MSLSSLAQSIVNASEWSHEDPQCRRAHAVAAAAELITAKVGAGSNGSLNDYIANIGTLADHIENALKTK
ncbi:hypothetical protein OLM63_10280 [Pseudomonas aeruginosa]|uniref:hypothetical protein n=1 Tax=Pseudomonas aeruginosa TaxID=287 RepID=UPI00106DC903|nr:hypothetical protein [Pseudomonas aeruginosa]MBH4203527.1 hypothetical protein [Pseudomonas aeruginosa]MDI2247802.1 hypothetical protein [Pseudomonas aeruginosa]HEK2227673.1 hypothetical protein [Pseudomonas aeruginosa]HEK2300151.1 hypothetical protein [Pseudomonas aeruginosa]